MRGNSHVRFLEGKAPVREPTYSTRNSRYRGDILKRTISNDCLKVFNLGDEKVILTVSFTPLET